MARPKITKAAPKTKKTSGKDKVGKKKVGKRNTGGEPTKHAKKMRATIEERDFEGDIAEGHDRKKNNIGPSGQGPHRGRERRIKSATASGRPDVSSAGSKRQRGTKTSNRHARTVP